MEQNGAACGVCRWAEGPDSTRGARVFGLLQFALGHGLLGVQAPRGRARKPLNMRILLCALAMRRSFSGRFVEALSVLNHSTRLPTTRAVFPMSLVRSVLSRQALKLEQAQ